MQQSPSTPTVVTILALLITAISTTYAVTANNSVRRLDTLDAKVQAIDIDRNVINNKLDTINATLKELKDAIQSND